MTLDITKRNKTILIVLILLVSFFMGSCSSGQSDENVLSRAAAGAKTVAGLEKSDTFFDKPEIAPPGDSLSDRLAMAFSLGGFDDDYDTYLKNLEGVVTERYAKSGKLDPYNATEWHRISLTVLSLGGDPTQFGTMPDGTTIDLIKDGTYDYADDLAYQGSNGLIYALITLDAKDYEVPVGSKYTRESILTELLEAQSEDGGFGILAGSSDIDVTAMAICALSNYKDEEEVENAISKALDYISSSQNEYGDFTSFGDRNSESVSQVIVALCALGIEPSSDERFIKNGTNLQEALLTYQNKDGSFRHLVNTEDPGEIMATEQAMLAFIAMDRLNAGQGSIYDYRR